MGMRFKAACVTGALAAVVLVGCGGSGSSPTAPSGGSGSGGTSGTSGPSGATITIGANGAVSPSQVTIAPGQSVTFVNNHSSPHAISSDPHPIHTDCPAINALGTLSAGQTKTTNAFTTSRTCGFHDHNNPGDTALQGRIVVQ